MNRPSRASFFFIDNIIIYFYLFIAGDYLDAAPNIPYELPDGRTLDVSADRFIVPELMFQPDLISTAHSVPFWFSSQFYQVFSLFLSLLLSTYLSIYLSN